MTRAAAALLSALLAACPAATAAAEEPFEFFSNEAKVVTASRRPQPAAEAPASVDVITADEIRASGAVNLWDLLRFRAGLDVLDGRQTSDGNRAIVSVRGLPREYVAELLVLVDGRSVYDAVSAGVTWHALPVQLQDIERIEIVRGPNAALYGPNAALGVINVITRKPRERSASLRQSFGSLGARLTEASVEDAGRSAGWRLSQTSRAQDGHRLASGAAANDFLFSNKANLRAWWRPSDAAELELFTGGSWDTSGVVSTRDSQARHRGHFEMLRLAQDLGRGGSLEATASRNDVYSEFDPSFSGTTRLRYFQEDVEALHRLAWADERLWTVWGGSYRRSAARSDQLFAGAPRQEQRLPRVFAHQTAALSDALTLSGGASYDLADDPDFQAAALIAPRPDHAFRASYASAKTVPGLYATGSRHQAARTVLLVGNPDLEPARTRTYETGYTGRFLERRLTLEARLFYLEVSGQPSLRATSFFPVMTLTTQNDNGVTARGAEAGARYAWRPGGWVSANYTHETAGDFRGAPEYRGTTPLHKVNLGGAVPLGAGVAASANAGYKDAYAAHSSVTGARLDVPAYWRLDARLAYEPRPGLELFIAAQNLLRPAHREFADGLEVPRTWQAGLSLRLP